MSVSDAAYQGVAGAGVTVHWAGGSMPATTDAHGLARIALAEQLPLGQHAELTVSASSGDLVGTAQVDTRDVARGLRELPPDDDRISLAGEWSFEPRAVPTGGDRDDQGARPRDLRRARPGGRRRDACRREFTVPESLAGRAVFIRFDGAYGHSEVSVNGEYAGSHGSGVTSFDLDISPS